MRAEQMPLAQILQEVARQTGMEIRGLEGLQEQVSVRFEHLPLPEGLQQLSVNYVVVWETSPQRGPRPVLSLVFRRKALSPPEALLREEIPSTVRTQLEGEPGPGGAQEERLRALHALAKQGNEEGLQKALFDSDPTIQATAFSLFAAQNQQGASAALLGLIESEQSEQRKQALQLLHLSRAIDEETVLAALGAALADEDATVKSYAIQALADRGGAEALTYLDQAFRDPDPGIRRLVLESVIQLDDGLPLVQEAALADTEETIRALVRLHLELAGSEPR